MLLSPVQGPLEDHRQDRDRPDFGLLQQWVLSSLVHFMVPSPTICQNNWDRQKPVLTGPGPPKKTVKDRSQTVLHSSFSTIQFFHTLAEATHPAHTQQKIALPFLSGPHQHILLLFSHQKYIGTIYVWLLAPTAKLAKQGS